MRTLLLLIPSLALAAPFNDIVTLPNPSTSGNVLTSDGTNWVSSPSSGAGSPYGYATFTTNTVLTSSSKKFQSCDTQYSTTTPVSISVTMPDCAAGTQGYEYVITHPLNTEAGACVVLPGAGDTIDIHAAWVMSAAGESVTLVCDSANNRWAISALTEYPTPWAWKDPTSAATTMVTVGGVVPTVTADGGATAGMMVGNTGPRINAATTAATNNFAQFATSGADTAEFLLSPSAQGIVALGNVQTAYRLWAAAFASATPNAANTLAAVGAGIVASTTGDAQWQCCTHDGSNGSCVDIGTLAIPAWNNTTALRVTLQTAFGLGVLCTVQILSNADSAAGTYGSVWKTTNIDATGTTDLGFYSSLTTLENVAKNLQLASMRVKVSR